MDFVRDGLRCFRFSAQNAIDPKFAEPRRPVKAMVFPACSQSRVLF